MLWCTGLKMKYFTQVYLFVLISLYGPVKCKALPKLLAVSKNFHFEFKPLKTLSFLIENPLGKFEWKHSIEKRDTQISPALNEIPLGPIEEKENTESKIIPIHTVVVPDAALAPVKPVDSGNPYSFLIPWSPEILLSPKREVVSPPPSELPPLRPQPVDVVTSFIEITPKPLAVVSEPVQPVPVNVVLNTPGENPPPAEQTPVFITEEQPKTPVMYTDINKIPLFSFNPVYPSPPAPVVQEVLPVVPAPVPPTVPPPPPKEEPPVPVKEEPPNYFVKGSRLLLFFGSKILQMLSQFVEGGASQVTLPNFTLGE